MTDLHTKFDFQPLNPFNMKKTLEGRHNILRYGLKYSWRTLNTLRQAGASCGDAENAI